MKYVSKDQKGRLKSAKFRLATRRIRNRQKRRFLSRLLFSTLVAGAAIPPSQHAAQAATLTTTKTQNLVSDPGFESSTAGFWTTAPDTVTRTTTQPISGKSSLRTQFSKWGSAAWWRVLSSKLPSAYATNFRVKGTFKGLVTSSTTRFRLCADVLYVDQPSKFIETCSNASQTTGALSSIEASVTLDPTRAVSHFNIKLTQDGSSPITYLADSVSAEVTYVTTVTPSPSPTPTVTVTVTPSPSPTPTVTVTPSPSPTPTVTVSAITGVWANDGGDKVTQDELRSKTPSSVINRTYDGTKVISFGARNEVVAFNLVLEAASQNANQVSITFNQLTGPSGAIIASTPTNSSGVFNYTGRNIELFLIKYLQIKGVSVLSYNTYDERHVPKRLQRPYTGNGYGTGLWTDRPDHDKFYPDIALPIEAAGTFNIAAGQNQSIWTDIYIPKTAPAGTYTGAITINVAGVPVRSIPVELTVRNFTLPDEPTSKTMVYNGYADINQRYLGVNYPNAGTTQATQSLLIRNRHFMMAHRHKISLIDANQGADVFNQDNPRAEWLPRLNGSLFTATQGYDGPGTGTGNNVYSIHTYGSWQGAWGTTQNAIQSHMNAWEQWFQTNAPQTERFLYLIDESTNFAQTEQWANWAATNPGIGSKLPTFATLAMPSALSSVPSLNFMASWFDVAPKTTWENANQIVQNTPSKKYFQYNGKRPANGSFATEDDGVALRQMAWAQYKKKVHRWFFWESTYYNDFQGGRGQTNVFKNAQTFGSVSGINASTGETGWNHSNGDGVLFYPGTDLVYPTESAGLTGPIASLRLKHWRRGIQDTDYLAMAYAKDPVGVQAIVDRMVPKVLWENDVTTLSDPTWTRTDIGWSINPDDWEQARAELARIIEGN